MMGASILISGFWVTEIRMVGSGNGKKKSVFYMRFYSYIKKPQPSGLRHKDSIVRRGQRLQKHKPHPS